MFVFSLLFIVKHLFNYSRIGFCDNSRAYEIEKNNGKSLFSEKTDKQPVFVDFAHLE